MTEQTFTLHNFRREDSIENWPHGRTRKVTAIFAHESNSRGQRISRTTTGKPKNSTYYDRICVVDGQDGKTHLIGFQHDHLWVKSADMKHDDFTIAKGEDNFDQYKTALYEVTG